MSTVVVTDANVITFISSDPLNVGFAAIRTAHPGEDQPLIDAANSRTGPGSGSVAGDPISASSLLDMIDAAEYVLLTTAQFAQLQTILAAQTIDVGSVPTQGKLDAILENSATSKASVQAGYTRAGSPWEVHFGKGLTADANIIDHARNSGAGSNF